MMEVVTDERVIKGLFTRPIIQKLKEVAGMFQVVEWYKGDRSRQEWGVKIVPSSIHQAFTIWKVVHNDFLVSGNGYDKFILRIDKQRNLTIEIYYRRPSMAGVTTEMYYNDKPVTTHYHAKR